MIHLIPLLLVFIILGCNSEQPIQNEPGTTRQAYKIPIISPNDIGVNDSILNDLTQKIKDQYYPNIHSVLILKEGNLIYEEYFAGDDQNYGENIGRRQFSDTSLHDLRSITKSVISALVGICIDKGFIKSVDQPISSFFPEFTFEGDKAKWTIEHFLTMTTGLDWNEKVPYNDPKNDEIQMTYSEDPIRYVLSKALIEAPGTKWNYSGGATQILAEIVTRTAKEPIDQFANEHLFRPLQIDKYEWNKYSKWGGADVFAAPSGLRLTSRDLLKIGLLYRNKGVWNGLQLLSKSWIEESFTRRIEFPCDIPNCTNYYCYQFWSWTDQLMDTDVNLVAAIGNGDQRIYWDIENDLVIVTTAGNYNQWDIENNSEKMYQEHIYPAIFNLNKNEFR